MGELLVDLLEFFAHTEWPAVAAGALWIIRKPIAALIDRVNITKLNAWGFTAEFEKSLNRIENTLTPAKEKKDERTIKESSNAPKLMYSFNISPEVMILDAWSWIEVTMRNLLEELEPASKEPYEMQFDFATAGRKLGLRNEEVDPLLTLQGLRNLVAHSGGVPISWEEAARFKKATEQLRQRMLDIRDQRRGNTK
jgi:hypothetical protein